MSNIKVNRNNYSKLERYDFNSILYVSPTSLPGCTPAISKESRPILKENLGSFSIQAAVRYPFNVCRGNPECVEGELPGVT